MPLRPGKAGRSFPSTGVMVFLTMLFTLFVGFPPPAEATGSPEREDRGIDTELRQRLREELPPVGTAGDSPAEMNRDFLRQYMDLSEEQTVLSRRFSSLGHNQAVHIFPAPTPAPTPPPAPAPSESHRQIPTAGTVFVVHGYLAHVTKMAPYVHTFLERGYTVVTPELPGHGLAGGAPAAIREFHQYGTFLADLLQEARLHEELFPQPWHIVGHSTGASAIWEHLRLYGDPFHAVVFVAPLVRSKFYRPTQVLRFLSRWLVDTVPTRVHHPLLPHCMPLSWFDAQVRWNRVLAEQEPIDRPVLIVQGNRDTVVAWRVNRRILQDAFPHSSYSVVRGADHVPHDGNTTPWFQTIQLITDWIEDPP